MGNEYRGPEDPTIDSGVEPPQEGVSDSDTTHFDIDAYNAGQESLRFDENAARQGDLEEAAQVRADLLAGADSDGDGLPTADSSVDD